MRPVHRLTPDSRQQSQLLLCSGRRESPEQQEGFRPRAARIIRSTVKRRAPATIAATMTVSAAEAYYGHMSRARAPAGRPGLRPRPDTSRGPA